MKPTTYRVGSHGWTSTTGVTIDLVEETDAPNPKRASAPVPLDTAKSLLVYAAMFTSPSFEPAYGPEPQPREAWRAYEAAFEACLKGAIEKAIETAHLAGEQAASGVLQAQRELAAAKREAVGWTAEHNETRGQHYGLNGPTSSAAAKCPLCKASLSSYANAAEDLAADPESASI